MPAAVLAAAAEAAGIAGMPAGHSLAVRTAGSSVRSHIAGIGRTLGRHTVGIRRSSDRSIVRTDRRAGRIVRQAGSFVRLV